MILLVWAAFLAAILAMIWMGFTAKRKVKDEREDGLIRCAIAMSIEMAANSSGVKNSIKQHVTPESVRAHFEREQQAKGGV